MIKNSIKVMIRFDKERFDVLEDYLYNIYCNYTNKFVQEIKRHPETEGKTMKEIKEICPSVYEAFEKANDFTEYTEKFLGYMYIECENRLKFIG